MESKEKKPRLELVIEEDRPEYTFKELNEMFDAGIMLEYLEKRSQEIQNNPDIVFGYVQGWKDRTKFEQWYLRLHRNIKIMSDFESGWSVRHIANKYYLSKTQIRRIIKERKQKRGE